MQFKDQMETAGFVNVTEAIYKWPSNRWPKEKRFKELDPSNSEARGFLAVRYQKN